MTVCAGPFATQTEPKAVWTDPGDGMAIDATSRAPPGEGGGLVVEGSLLAVALGDGGRLVWAGSLLAVALGEGGGLVALGVAVPPLAHDPRSAAVATTAQVCIARCRNVRAGVVAPPVGPVADLGTSSPIGLGAIRSWPIAPRG